ncbi:MAG: flavin reductase family protein [Fimbriimonadaceae bacterium]
MPEFVSFRCDNLSPDEAYSLLASAVVPRPIAFVSTQSSSGVCNLAPFSFFMAGGANPPSLALSINQGQGGRRKDTLKNIEESGEFVVNLVTRSMAEGMNATSAGLPPEQSEWPYTSLNQTASHFVRPARVAESPVQFECRLFRVIDHGAGAGAAVYVIGEILAIHVMDCYLQRGVIADLDLISRLGGPNYLDLGSNARFEMERPS